MVHATIPARMPGRSLVHAPVRPSVVIGGARRHDLVVASWLVEPAPDFGLLVLRHADAPPERTDLLPPVGASVRVQLGPAVFEGPVVRHVTELADGAQALEAHVRHRLWHALREPVLGRWQLEGGAAAWREEEPVAFDAETVLASAETVEVRGRPVHVFDDSDAARPWTALEALEYLLAAHLPAAVAGPSGAELSALAAEPGALTADLRLDDVPLGEALARAAAQAGLALRAAQADPARLVAYGPGRSGNRRRLALAVAGAALAGSGSNVQSVRVEHAPRPDGATPLDPPEAPAPGGWWRLLRWPPKRRRPVLALGRPGRFEVTLELHPGWDASLHTSRYRDFVRSEAPDWPAVSDVLRKWVLNESGRYGGPPCEAPPCDCGSIDAAFVRRVPRRLEPCLSIDGFGFGRGVVVEVSLDAGATWSRYAGAVLLAQGECSLYLDDDALPGPYVQAALAGQARIRVTGVLAADRPLRVFLPGDLRRPVRVLRRPRLGRDRVHSWSLFHPAPAGVERDDLAALEAAARRAQAEATSPSAAQVLLAWVDPAFHVGDRVERIEGRGLSLGGSADAGPHVHAVLHRFGEEWDTRLWIED